MNKPDQTTIITALEKNNVSYDEIRFSQVGKVSIRKEITDLETIQMAQCGIFSNLKITAIKIWDILGTSRDNESGDIDYFVIVCEGTYIAVFNIYPDMDRASYSARDKAIQGWTEDREEILLEAAIEVENGAELEEVVKEVIELKFKGYSAQSIRSATIRFRKDILELLPERKYENLEIIAAKENYEVEKSKLW